MEDFFECNKSNYNLHGHHERWQSRGAVRTPDQVFAVNVFWIFGMVFWEQWFLQVQ